VRIGVLLVLVSFGTVNPFAPGTTIGTYRLDHQIGEGGMGTVCRATDMKLNRGVAIKFVSTEVADASARRRFQREGCRSASGSTAGSQSKTV
jgi:serine/threonine protein kinase